MEFDDYTDLICTSVAEQGYDYFFPCVCVPGDDPIMSVMEGELTPAGEEDVAKAWVAECFAEYPELYFAFRAGGREVHVCWLKDSVIRKRFRAQVEPAED